jgi:ADP-ribose pyrophosphatase YjhB (NUDIX family)
MSNRHTIHVELPGAPTFNFRAAGIVLDEGWVLLHRSEADDFWAPPGGRVELGEPAVASLAREMREETGVDVQVGPLLWVAESFFSSGGRAQHGLCFYFLIHLPKGCPFLDKADLHRGIEEDAHLEFRWFPLNSLADVDLRPAFLRDTLQVIPESPVHILDIERR